MAAVASPWPLWRAWPLSLVAAVVAAAVQSVCDWWYKEEQPLLTPERRAALTAGWAAAVVGGGADRDAAGEAALSLRTAFELILLPDEQEEVGYEAFEDDVRGHLEQPQADSITLWEALAYLEASQ